MKMINQESKKFIFCQDLLSMMSFIVISFHLFVYLLAQNPGESGTFGIFAI